MSEIETIKHHLNKNIRHGFNRFRFVFISVSARKNRKHDRGPGPAIRVLKQVHFVFVCQQFVCFFHKSWFANRCAFISYLYNMFLSTIISFVIFFLYNAIFQEMQSDLFRTSANYKVLRSSLPFSKEKPFEDKNFKCIKHQVPVVCQEHNVTTLPVNHKYLFKDFTILLIRFSNNLTTSYLNVWFLV